MGKKIKLNKFKSLESINKESFINLEINQDNKEIPINEIEGVLNVSEQFNKERNESSLFRLTGTINPIMSNILCNTTGEGSLSVFNKIEFRDRSYPSDGLLTNDDDLSFKESIIEHLVNINGWCGYYDPTISSKVNCKLIEMHPKKESFSFLKTNGIKNWCISITYPFQKLVTNLVGIGLLVIKKEVVTFNNRSMVRFTTPVNHGLNRGDKIRLFNLSNPSLNGDYIVFKTGLENGDNKENYFLIDINPSVDITSTTKVSRLVNGSPSEYYYRVFKKIKTKYSQIMEDDDYEVFQMGFANNIFNDNILQFIINEEIDISELTDNLNRPLTEIYLSILKTDSNGTFSTVKSGLNLNYIDDVASPNSIPDIRKINNSTSSPTPLEVGLDSADTTFLGDLVEYNKYTLIERTLSNVNHRFNTINRDLGGIIISPANEASVNMGNRYEGYFYNPHHKIRIRELSDYIEQGDQTTGDIPEYAENLGDGRFLWRDIYSIGINASSNSPNYPFLNGCHYINKNINFNLKRQDPFGNYGLFYNTFPRDSGGVVINDIGIKKDTDYEC